MSERIDDGGPAFPNKDELGNMVPAITLRDWFAGQALASLQVPLSALHDVDAVYKRKATHCYRMADAMIAARKGAKA